MPFLARGASGTATEAATSPLKSTSPAFYKLNQAVTQQCGENWCI